MKKNVLLSVVGVLLILGIGISFAYFVSQVLITGSGSDVGLNTNDLMKVTYDAGSGIINADKMMPGEVASKNFSVTITPTNEEKEVTYAIILDITDNTFVKCDDSNYNAITNACIKDKDELVYRLKNNNDVIAEGSLMGVSGEQVVVKETKTIETQTTYNYTLEIEFVETGADQNHNANKMFNANVKVKFNELVGSEYILANYGTVLTRNDFSISIENTTTGTIYKSLDKTQYDNDGEVYYFAGNPTDNWLQFGGYYWRIIRINGDGSIRIIYSGDNDSGPVATGEDTQIGVSSFNTNNNDNAYVGYMYGMPGSSTYSETHTNIHASAIKKVLDIWYVDHLQNYSQYISVEAGFCGDRTPSTNRNSQNGEGGYGEVATYYGLHVRRSLPNVSVGFQCSTNDLYTVIGSNDGNHALTYPIGLISGDEIAYSGGRGSASGEKLNYYLDSEKDYWTMSPGIFHIDYLNGNNARMFLVSSNGTFASGSVSNTYGIRPVINLKADVQLSGSGTSTDPYVVE